jgi:hypothetical protein
MGAVPRPPSVLSRQVRQTRCACLEYVCSAQLVHAGMAGAVLARLELDLRGRVEADDALLLAVLERNGGLCLCRFAPHARGPCGCGGHAGPGMCYLAAPPHPLDGTAVCCIGATSDIPGACKLPLPLYQVRKAASEAGLASPMGHESLIRRTHRLSRGGGPGEPRRQEHSPPKKIHILLAARCAGPAPLRSGRIALTLMCRANPATAERLAQDDLSGSPPVCCCSGSGVGCNI